MTRITYIGIKERPSLTSYVPEYNEDGTEKHITCEGAYFHVISWDEYGQRCSCKNCEVNARRQKRISETGPLPPLPPVLY